MSFHSKYFRSMVTLAAASGIVFACTSGGGSLTPAERDAAEMAIAQLARNYERAWNAGDKATLESFYTDDAIIQNTQGEDFRGAAGIQAYHDMVMADSISYSGATISTAETVIMGEDAFSYGTATATRKMGNGPAMEITWKFSNLLHQVNGEWKIRKSLAVQTDPPLVQPTMAQ